MPGDLLVMRKGVAWGFSVFNYGKDLVMARLSAESLAVFSMKGAVIKRDGKTVEVYEYVPGVGARKVA